MADGIHAEGNDDGSGMSDDDTTIDTDDLERRMEGAMSALRGDFQSLRTGRASASMLDGIMVPAYGQPTPLNQVASVNVPEPRMLTVSVWDKANVNAADKAIREAGLGLNPVMDGTTLRLPVPELNEERRRDLSKMAGGYAENARVAIRNVRRDGMERIKKAKSSGMSEDDAKLWEGEVQEMTDRHIKAVDAALTQKQAEIMQV